MQNENNRQVKKETVAESKDKISLFPVSDRYERYLLAKRHLRGTSRPKVFPVGQSNSINDQVRPSEKQKRNWASCLSTRYGQRWTDECYIGNKLMIRDGRDNRSCLRAGRTPELGIVGVSIRRLTPVECERLQGFPDQWTKYGKEGEVISDSQRYKMCGNAVTVNVVRYILNSLTQS